MCLAAFVYRFSFFSASLCVPIILHFVVLLETRSHTANIVAVVVWDSGGGIQRTKNYVSDRERMAFFLY